MTHQIALPAALTVDCYLRVDGSDADDGRTPTTAWKTITHAQVTAPPGAVVQVGPGRFLGQETPVGQAGRTQPIIWQAEYPVADVPDQPDLWTVVEGSLQATPTDASWQSIYVRGPVEGRYHRVWRWQTGSALSRLSLGYSATSDEVPKRVAYWKADTARLSTPGGWAELVETNRTQRSGYYQHGTDLYAMLPFAPNTMYWQAGSGCGLALDAPDCRVSGIVFRGFDRAIQFGPHADRFVVDRCRIETCNSGVFAAGLAPSTAPRGVLIEHNAMVNTGLWSDDQSADPSIPWVFIKSQIELVDGSRYPTAKIGGVMEGAGIWLTAAGAVIRNNEIEGFQNGIVGWGTTSSWCISDNVIRRIQDDAIEPEGHASFWLILRNTVEDATTFLSTAPVHDGPLFVYGNRARIGLRGLARTDGGVVDGLSAVFFKYSRASNPQAHVYLAGNTLVTDGTDAVSGGAQYASGSGVPEFYHLGSNVFITSRNGWEYHAGQLEERCNQFVTSDPLRGMKNLTTGVTATTFAAYRSASGQGAGSNPFDLHDGASVAAMIDADLRLTPAGQVALLGWGALL